MEKSLKLYQPKSPYKPWIYLSFIMAVIIIVFLFNSPKNPNAIDKIFLFIFLITLILLILSLSISMYAHFVLIKYFPTIKIFKNKIMFEYGNGKKGILKKAEIKSITRRLTRIYVVGIKFKNLKRHINKTKSVRKNDIFLIIVGYLYLKFNGVPIKFKQFYSNKLKDEKYINYNISKINEKRIGFHYWIPEYLYSSDYANKIFKKIKKMEAKELFNDLKKALI